MRKLVSSVGLFGAMLAADAALATDGQSAVDMLKGNTIRGESETRANRFYMYFAEGGVVKVFYSNLGKHDQGKWETRDSKICLNIPDNPAQCFNVTIEGDDVSLLANGERSPLKGILMEGNPKNL